MGNKNGSILFGSYGVLPYDIASWYPSVSENRFPMSKGDADDYVYCDTDSIKSENVSISFRKQLNKSLRFYGVVIDTGDLDE